MAKRVEYEELNRKVKMMYLNKKRQDEDLRRKMNENLKENN